MAPWSFFLSSFFILQLLFDETGASFLAETSRFSRTDFYFDKNLKKYSKWKGFAELLTKWNLILGLL